MPPLDGYARRFSSGNARASSVAEAVATAARPPGGLLRGRLAAQHAADAVKPLTFADLLAMQYRGDGTTVLMNGRRTRVLVTVFTSVRERAVRVVVADAETQAIRARRQFSSLGEAVTFTNEALLA